MPHSNRKSRRLIVAVALAVIASAMLAACGSSSSTTTNASANAASSTSGASGASGPRGAFGARFSALRECLAKNGITLPKRTPGSRPSPGTGGGVFGGAGGAGPQLPKGVTRAQYEAALKKCGGGLLGRPRSFNSPARVAALAKFASCMRQNGINLPAPNTSGSGPIFDTKSVNTSSAQFKAAESKCSADLTGAFRRGPTGGQVGTPG